MNKNVLLICLLFLLTLAGTTTAQILTCNDLVYVSLDENCSHTLEPDQVLDGIVPNNCVVEIDKIPPYGNGPWGPADLSVADIGKTYQFRVRHMPSGNMCWGDVKAEDKLPPRMNCSGLSTIDLNGNTQLTIPTTDLNITAGDNCSGVTLSPATLQLTCSGLGISTVQLTATDASGNASTCSHTVLSTNETNCQPCVGQCPESVPVDFETGNIDLLTAFNNNDWSAFDAYGNALYNTTCAALIDSTFTLDYHLGAAGQSWFSRKWVWVNDQFEFYTCEQIIAFPTTRNISLNGKVFLDGDADCQPDAGERGILYFPLKITKQPSGQTETISFTPNAVYNYEIKFTAQDQSADVYLELPPGVNPVCPSALNIPNTASPSAYTFDIGLRSGGDCPRMQVNIGNLFFRRCATNLISINYCNTGVDTAYGAYITVDLDPLISVASAGAPYTVDGPDSIYTFQLGDVPPFTCATLAVYGAVDCNASLGQTVCVEANIYPEEPCNGSWPGARVTAHAECEGDSVKMVLKNTGIGDMMSPLDYIVIEDFIMYKNGTFQLEAGDSVIIKSPANGSTWRIEANQAPGFPTPGMVAASEEGCGGFGSMGLINAFEENEEGPFYDIYCGEIRGSCDPNDKNAVPAGVTEDHLIRANQVLEYKIRFQNTGNDAAYKVVVVDTLSSLLDLNTLETGASSHPYKVKIYPGGILHFVFDPIVLPDSNTNEIASHGFVDFRINQKPNLPDGTVIENTVAIYFDQNDPVFTNTAFHTIGSPIVIPPPLAFSAQTQSPRCHGAADGYILGTTSGGKAPYTYQWNNAAWQGDSLVGLPAGAYHLTLTDNYGHELIQSFTLTDPPALELTMGSTPEHNGNSDGTATAGPNGGTGAYTFIWNTDATTSTLIGVTAGTYTVTVTDANGCTKSNTVVVGQLVGAGEPALASQISVWPNPAHDRLMLDLHKALPQLLRLEVLSVDGRVLQHLQASELKALHTLSLEGIPTDSMIILVFYSKNGSTHATRVMVR